MAIVLENIKGELKGHMSEFVSLEKSEHFVFFLHLMSGEEKTIKRASKLASSQKN